MQYEDVVMREGDTSRTATMVVVVLITGAGASAGGGGAGGGTSTMTGSAGAGGGGGGGGGAGGATTTSSLTPVSSTPSACSERADTTSSSPKQHLLELGHVIYKSWWVSFHLLCL